MPPRSSSLCKPILLLLSFPLLLAGACQSPESSSSPTHLPSPPAFGTVEVDVTIDTCTLSAPSLQTCTVLLRRVRAYGRGTPVLADGRTITATVRSEVVQARSRTGRASSQLQPGEQLSAVLQYEQAGAIQPESEIESGIEDGRWSMITIRSQE